MENTSPPNLIDFLHDLRNNLAIVDGNVRIMRRIVAKVSDEETRADLLDRIGKAIDAGKKIKAQIEAFEATIQGLQGLTSL